MEKKKVTQPSLAPTRKVTYGAVFGSLSTLAALVVAFTPVRISDRLEPFAPFLGALSTLILQSTAAWLVHEYEQRSPGD